MPPPTAGPGADNATRRSPSVAVADLRQSYTRAGLAETDLAATWTEQFERWLTDAVTAGLREPNAMVLATADAGGRPSARTVLLKGYDPRGLVWFTNYGSRKGRDVEVNPQASVVFPWLELERQVVLAGRVERVASEETAAYFHSRPRGSQLGAWASPQSQVIADRAVLDEALAQLAARYPGEVPVPPQWGGLRLIPDAVEFWQGRPNRLHDRLRFRRGEAGWVVERLAP